MAQRSDLDYFDQFSSESQGSDSSHVMGYVSNSGAPIGQTAVGDSGCVKVQGRA